MNSMFLCLGSTLAALIGLLVLGWGANRERWRPLWVLIAAVFLIGAAFGAAETVFQVATERTEEQTLEETAVSKVSVAPTPVPSRAQDLSALPSATPTPSAVQRPTAAAAETPTATPRATSAARPTLTPRPSSTPTIKPTAAVVEPSAAASVDLDVLAPSLIPAERDVLASLDDPPHYLINATVDFDALTVSGTAEIHYTNNETEELDAIYLRLYPNADHYEEGEIQIHAVNVDGDAADFRLEDPEHTTLKVPLPEPLGHDEQTKLQIAFTVTVPRRSDRFGYDQGVMSLGHWYPMLAVYDDEGWNLDPYVALGDPFYSDVANFAVHITVPEDTMIASSGVPVGEILHRPPHKTVVYGSGATREFALALSREYETARIQIGDTTVTSYYLPGHARSGVRALEVAADALEVYNDRFGLYPYTELDIAETSFTVMGAPGGMEFPGVVFIGSDLYDPDSVFAFETDMIVAHEVAHQWWYGVVGNNQVDEPWLDEAFATYSSIIYYQDQGDPATAEVAYWLQAVLPYQMVQMLGADGPLQSSLLDFDDELITYQSLVYSKGALFLARLRELLGDETFFALLQNHYEAHKYGLLEPDAFRRSLEEITRDSDLDESGRAEILELYDAVVVRGEPIEGMAELDVLEGLDGMLEGQLSAGDMEEMLGLAEHLGGLLDGEVTPEELEDIMLFLEELLTGMEP